MARTLQGRDTTGKEALDIFKKLGEVKEQAWCSNYLTRLFLEDNQLDLAEDAAFCTIDLVPENEYIVCQSHRRLGQIYDFKGEREKAIRPLSKSHPALTGKIDCFGFITP